MKRTWFVLLASVLLAGLTAAAMGQSLGDVARKQRAQKKPTAKVYTNDDLTDLNPDSVSVVGEPAPPPDQTKTDEKGEGKAAPGEDKSKGDNKAAPDKSTDDKTKGASDNDKTKADIADTKKQIATLEHDIDIMQREFRLRSANFYADAGNSLRDPKAWADEQRKYQDDLKTKQDSLNDLKQKLSDLQDQGRKAGMNAADLE